MHGGEGRGAQAMASPGAATGEGDVATDAAAGEEEEVATDAATDSYFWGIDPYSFIFRES